uniref:(northern house mosquito) hypothetical protein n=1 Tax=Culex pipiens TaxID=7175 RepID=A0A8D8NGQ4_CULPI
MSVPDHVDREKLLAGSAAGSFVSFQPTGRGSLDRSACARSHLQGSVQRQWPLLGRVLLRVSPGSAADLLQPLLLPHHQRNEGEHDPGVERCRTDRGSAHQGREEGGGAREPDPAEDQDEDGPHQGDAAEDPGAGARSDHARESDPFRRLLHVRGHRARVRAGPDAAP